VHINQNILTYNSKLKTHNELQNKIWYQTMPLVLWCDLNIKMWKLRFQSNSPRINLIDTKNQDLIHNELNYQQMITRKKTITINTLHPRPPIATPKECWIFKVIFEGSKYVSKGCWIYKVIFEEPKYVSNELSWCHCEYFTKGYKRQAHMLKIEFIPTRFWKATIQTTKKNYEQIIQRWILKGNHVQLRNIQWC